MKRVLGRLCAALLAALVALAAAPGVARAENWLWPVPASTQINQECHSGHVALDIGGSRGTPIVASRAGTVRRALSPDTVDSNWQGYGYGVVIDHGDGYYSHYAHMDTRAVSEGQYVSRGQQIGTMGMTGNATGVHLHFAIKTSPYGGGGGAIWNNPGTDINYDYSNDTTPPTISNLQIKDMGEFGFTVTAEAADNAGLSIVQCVVWTEKGGQDDVATYTMGWVSGGTFTVNVPYSDHYNERGKYIAHVYAYDTSGNSSSAGVERTIDSTPPTISDVQVTNIDKYGYTVSCKVTDATGILRVQFPSWTIKDGQDDIAESWWNNPVASGTKSGDTYTFRVSASDHNNEPGPYFTYIYAYDAVRNETEYKLSEVDLGPYMNDTEPPVIQSVTVVEQNDERLVVDVVATDNVGVTRVYCKGGDLLSSEKVILSIVGADGVKTSGTTWRFTVTFANYTKPDSKGDIGMGADRHRIVFVAQDASNNNSSKSNTLSDDNPHVDYDLQCGRHVSLGVGETLSSTEVFGKSNWLGYQVLGWNQGIVKLSDNSDSITGLEEGNCWLYLLNNKTGGITSAYVTVGSPAVDLSTTTIAAIPDQTYTGKEIKPALTVRNGSTTLKAGIDYTAAYGSNINAGTATVTLTGKGGYTGTKSATFKIKPTAISKASVSAIPGQTYTGSALKPKPKLTFNGATLKEGTDYSLAYQDNINVGTATITITGKGNYTGTTSTTFAITKQAASNEPVSLAKAKVTLSTTSYTYDGKAKKPGVKSVILGDNTLRSGTDYTIKYANNINAGTATVTITGKGRYTGTVKATFTIKPASIAKAKVAKIADQYATGKALKLAPKATLVLGGKTVTLKAGTDYTVGYKNNIKAGTATVTLTGRGNFTGTVKTTFKIIARWQRLAGPNAVGTMQAIVRADGVFTAAKVDTVVVAGRRDFKAALAGTGLAGLYKAPLLITEPAALSGPTRTELKRLTPSRVLVCGDTSVVSDAALSAIRSAVPGAKVSRVSGATPSATAVAIHTAGDLSSAGWGRTCVVATQAAFKDALSIAPYSYWAHAPIFFTESTRMNDGKGLSSATVSAIRSGGFSRVLIVGGELAVPKSVEKQLSGMRCERLAGANAIETSRIIGLFELGEGMNRKHLAVATTQDFADALAGAALAGAQGSVLVLANQTGGYGAFNALCNSSQLQHGHVLGGPFAISEASEAYFSKR